MRIMGVDPGTIVCGYGIIDDQDGEMSLITCNAVKCQPRSPIGERLLVIYRELSGAARKFMPDEMAIETPFVGENVKSALAVGKAQAIALLVAAEQTIPCYEYSPARVKQNVSDYGASTKEQMQEMVKLLLDLEEVPEPHDAADALAVAICHLREAKLREMIEQSKG
jgi:crossover junction endodeoxyribonuclease RuvC